VEQEMKNPLPTIRLRKLTSKIGSGITPSGGESAYVNNGITFIRSQNVREGYLDLADAAQISAEQHNAMNGSRVSDLDVLLNITGASIGRSAVVPVGTGEANVNQHVCIIRTNKLLDPYFLSHFLNSYLGQKQIWSFQGGGSREGLNYQQISLFDLPAIAIGEQRRISTILNEWDAEIRIAEQLIVAKELLQRGAMQKLIMRKAYPEHHLSEFVHRVTRKNAAGNGLPLTISGRDGLISQSDFFDKRIAAETADHYALLKRGEFSYNRSYSAGYPYGAIKRLEKYDEGIVSSLYLCFALNPGSVLNSDYFVYFCEAGGFNHQIHKVAQEGARNHGLLNIAAHDFFAMKLPLPPMEEQSRVAAILGSAGQELTLLRKTLDQLRKQKRGLMQKLLTGQWRVKSQEEVKA
jgi:type I restriction enzyme, S subunit